jgi:sigma-B regulation protein RsbU (phosphoserine phosphatase)
MAQPTITLAASASAGDAASRWWRPIAAAWPRHGKAPALVSVPLNELASKLSSPEEAEHLADRGPLLIVLGPDAAGAALLRLVDHLQQQSIPCLLLFPVVDGPTRALQAGGLLVESWDADPAFLAAALFTLDQRQSTVSALARDLAIANRYQGGVRGEIDRIHDELNLAASVQQELLPRRMPDRGGLQFGTLFRPAGYVSGDIYDVIELDDEGRYIGFFIADAVGHGVPAALMTMVIHRSLRMTRERGSREIVWPGEAMTRLNEELCRGKRESPRFTTAVYGVVDTRTWQVTLTGAGHPPPLRIRGRTLTRVETEGPLLGVFPDEKYLDTTFTLAPDETLLLYSDGFETAFAPPESQAHRRKSADSYLTELATLAWPSADNPVPIVASLSELEHLIDSQAGSLHQIDDVTAVAIYAGKAAAQATQPDTVRAAA